RRGEDNSSLHLLGAFRRLGFVADSGALFTTQQRNQRGGRRSEVLQSLIKRGARGDSPGPSSRGAQSLREQTTQPLCLLQERARDSRVDEDRGRDQHHRQVGADLVRRGCAVTGVTYSCYNAGGTSGLREHNGGLRCRRTGSVTQ